MMRKAKAIDLQKILRKDMILSSKVRKQVIKLAVDTNM